MKHNKATKYKKARKYEDLKNPDLQISPGERLFIIRRQGKQLKSAKRNQVKLVKFDVKVAKQEYASGTSLVDLGKKYHMAVTKLRMLLGID